MLSSRAAPPVTRAASTRHRAITRRVLAALVFTAMSSSPAGASTAATSPAPRATAPGSIGVRLVDAPVAARSDPRAQVYIVDHLAPGTVIHRRIEVSNTTTATAHILLYAAAATIVKGSFLGSAGHTPNDLSTWTSVSPAAPDVPAGGRVIATVTITVPPDTAPGEQYGVVWAEVGAASAAGGGSADVGPASGVHEVNRVGIRLYVDVGPGGAPAANFTIDSLTAKRTPDGQPMIVATVHNTGGRALDMNGTLQLRNGPGGLNAGPFPASLGTTLAIGDTEPVTIALDKQVPAGPWDAQITLRSGLIERTAQATVTFPDTGTAPAVKTTTTQPGWLLPAIIGLIILLLLGVAALLLKRWRVRLRLRSTNAIAPDEAPELTNQGLSR